MSRPILWTDAWHNLKTLRLGVWLEATVANFYLSHVWYDGLARSRMRYLDMYAAMAVDLCDEELDDIRRYHFISSDGAYPIVPVGFVVHHSAHFFIVIFDLQRRTAHILGRHVSGDAMRGTNPNDWKAWGGPEYWRKIAALHGWSAGDPVDVRIKTRNWEQNGLDCGPIACSVLEQVLTAGLDKDGNVPPIHIQCGHILRMKMFRIISAQIQISCRDYMMLLDSPETHRLSHYIPDEEVISAIQRGQHPVTCRGLLEKLAASSAKCQGCRNPTSIQATSDCFVTIDNYHGISNDDTNPFTDEEVFKQQDLQQGRSTTFHSTMQHSIYS